MKSDRTETLPEKEQKKTGKKNYEKPELKIHGTVEKLTESNFLGGNFGLSTDSPMLG